MEAQKLKLQYFSRTARYLHSIKSVNSAAMGTFIQVPMQILPRTPFALIGIKHFFEFLNRNLSIFKFSSKCFGVNYKQKCSRAFSDFRHLIGLLYLRLLVGGLVSQKYNVFCIVTWVWTAPLNDIHEPF